MTITTKFNEKELVYSIDNDRIVRLPVYSIEYSGSTIRYCLLISEGLMLGDKGSYLNKKESECFASVKELVDYWTERLRDKK